jgi:hypothetical protein
VADDVPACACGERAITKETVNGSTLHYCELHDPWVISLSHRMARNSRRGKGFGVAYPYAKRRRVP